MTRMEVAHALSSSKAKHWYIPYILFEEGHDYEYRYEGWGLGDRNLILLALFRDDKALAFRSFERLSGLYQDANNPLNLRISSHTTKRDMPIIAEGAVLTEDVKTRYALEGVHARLLSRSDEVRWEDGSADPFQFETAVYRVPSTGDCILVVLARMDPFLRGGREVVEGVYRIGKPGTRALIRGGDVRIVGAPAILGNARSTEADRLSRESVNTRYEWRDTLVASGYLEEASEVFGQGKRGEADSGVGGVRNLKKD
jgi:hypothetical protein